MQENSVPGKSVSEINH